MYYLTVLYVLLHVRFCSNINLKIGTYELKNIKIFYFEYIMNKFQMWHRISKITDAFGNSNYKLPSTYFSDDPMHRIMFSYLKFTIRNFALRILDFINFML